MTSWPFFARYLVPNARVENEQGFTVIESMVALGVIFTVLMGLLGTVGAGVKGVVLSRQRLGATSIANEVLEQARGRAYGEVGHDLDDDATLATDTAITGTLGTYAYGGEFLVPSTINGASNAPFTPHTWTSTRDGSPYTVWVYVTRITPAAGNGDEYKHLTVKVTWTNAQFNTNAVSRQVVESTYLYNTVKPPNPWLDGVVDAEGGAMNLTGTITGIDLAEAHLWFPYSHGEVHSRDVQEAKGYSGTTRAQIAVVGGSLTGCTVSADGKTSDCPGQQAVSLADNDAGTTPPEYDKHVLTDVGHSVAAGLLNFGFGAGNSATSESAARSKAASACAGVLGNDVLPFQCSDGVGPSSINVGFGVGTLSGTLLGASTSARATGTVDRTDAPGASRIASVAKTSVPALNILGLNGGPLGYIGIATIGAVNVTATANAGQGAAAPSIVAAPFTVSLWDTSLAVPAYKSITVTPGTAQTNTLTSNLNIAGNSITMDVTTVTQPAVTSSTSDATGAITHAEASLNNWLDITVHCVVIAGGSTIADFLVDMDYGRIDTQSDYQLN